MALTKVRTGGLTDDAVTTDKLYTPNLGRRNLIINGAMTIWQRGTTVDTASTGDYMCDRWRINFTGLDGNVDWDQETSSTPDGFGYALKISTDASESSLDAADNLKIQQRLEGQDLQQLKKGTSSAEKTTLSFWVKSSVASTYTMEVVDNNNSRAISKSYTISSADTWEHKTIVFEGDTTGTLTNDNNASMTWNIYIDSGSNFTSGTFSTSWQATSNTERVFDTTGWLESTSPEFYITGVQWEVNEQATPFEHRSYAEELALCQRYYQFYGAATGTYYTLFPCARWSLNTGFITIFTHENMRAAPSLSSAAGSGPGIVIGNGSSDTFTIGNLTVQDYDGRVATITIGLDFNPSSTHAYICMLYEDNILALSSEL